MKNNKPTKFILKGYAGRHISKGDDPTDADRTMMYNGIPVKWFIGDVNFSRAMQVGCTDKNAEAFPASGSVRVTNKNGAYWEAWGSCLGHGYQLFAWFNQETSELSDIIVLSDKSSPRFNQEIYDKLTKEYPNTQQ